MTTSAYRVLVLVTSTDRRGAEIEGERLSRELCAAGLDSRALALAPGKTDQPLSIPTIGRSPTSPSTLKALRRTASEFDLVLAYGSSTLPACAASLTGTGTQFVYRSIGDPGAWSGGLARRFRTSLLLARASMVVTLWPDAASAMQRLYRVRTDRLAAIPNARSNLEFSPASSSQRHDARARLGLGDQDFVVSMIGALSEEKRVDLALSAIAMAPECRMIIVGDGPQRRILENQARVDQRLGSRVVFTGPTSDVAAALHASDVLMMTSRTEGMPGVVIEAGLCGVPVISTDVGAVRWMSDHRVFDGEVLAADVSPADLAAVVQRMRTTARSTWSGAQDSPCEWTSVVPQWVEVIESLKGAPSARQNASG